MRRTAVRAFVDDDDDDDRARGIQILEEVYHQQTTTQRYQTAATIPIPVVMYSTHDLPTWHYYNNYNNSGTAYCNPYIARIV